MTIERMRVALHDRVQVSSDLFGWYFPMKLEPMVYAMAGNIAPDYDGGYWQFYRLSNGGFYMAPEAEHRFAVCCENGFEGWLSADALGITACLYAYSQLSFSGIPNFAELCAEQYHWLRHYMLAQPEAGSVLRAID